MPKERRELIDGVPIIHVDKLPEPRPSLLFEWDLKDNRHRPLRVSDSRTCEFCAQALPCRWCNMADEWNLED